MTCVECVPGYLRLFASGELVRRAQIAGTRLRACTVCPRVCGVDRLESAGGASCRIGRKAVVASAHPHFGEEEPLVGRNGSGTIFFSGCNLHCNFCQNFDLSQCGEGSEVSDDDLAAMMINLQRQGCHNINLVSPSHIVPQFLAALVIAVDQGLRLPIVYNSGGYDSIETLALLDGVIDIYMPDMKYADAGVAQRLSDVEDYPATNQAAVLEMFRQVDDLIIDETGIARRGLLVRHLVLPEGLAGTGEIVQFLAEQVSGSTYINVMAQYHPSYRSRHYPPLDRTITDQEYLAAIALTQTAGLRLDQRRTKFRL